MSSRGRTEEGEKALRRHISNSLYISFLSLLDIHIFSYKNENVMPTALGQRKMQQIRAFQDKALPLLNRLSTAADRRLTGQEDT